MLDTPDTRFPADLNPSDAASNAPRRPKGRDANLRSGRMVRNVPTEVRQRRFATSFRGYDRIEVRMFLSELADDLEQALQEIGAQNRDLARMDQLLEEHRTREQTLRDTLLTAQQLSDDLKVKAQHEAEGIVKEAEARSDQLVEKAHERLADIEREIERLKSKRQDVEREIEESLASLQRTLDAIRTQDRKDAEERIRLLRPRRSGTETPAESTRDSSDDLETSNRLREHQS